MATTWSCEMSRSVSLCAVAGLPWWSAKTTSTLRPPRPGRPDVGGERDGGELGMRVVDDLHPDLDRLLHLGAGGGDGAAQRVGGADADRARLRPRERGEQDRQQGEGPACRARTCDAPWCRLRRLRQCWHDRAGVLTRAPG